MNSLNCDHKSPALHKVVAREMSRWARAVARLMSATKPPGFVGGRLPVPAERQKQAGQHGGSKSPMNLWADFLTHEGRVVRKWQQYFPVYEKHFSRFVYRPCVFWEIGCGQGGSLQMWRRYFGPHVQIVGIDIRPECSEFADDQVAVRIGDQRDQAFLSETLREFGQPDIVLDDGSHKMADVIDTFKYVYPRMDRNGVYMVEDMHTAYWPQFGGGLGKKGTFVELCKGLIDEMNGAYSDQRTEFTSSTMSMHFYDSMVVFERGARQPNKPLVKRPNRPVTPGKMRESSGGSG